MARGRNERPAVVDRKRVLQDIPPGHWTWAGDGIMWIRLILFEKSRGIELNRDYLNKIKPTCGVGRCIKPSHQRLYARTLPEELAMQGITPKDLAK